MIPLPPPPPAPPPTEAEWVAPGPDTLASAMDELDRRLTAAEALGRGAARWQNQRRPGDRTCDQGAGPYLQLADTWHAAAQRARAQAERVDWLWDAATLADVRPAEVRERWLTLEARSEAAARSWMVFRAWHQRFGPRCSTRPPVAPATPEGEPANGLHVVWVVEGQLCSDLEDPDTWTAPLASAADGTGPYLVWGPACVEVSERCSCQPEPLPPGAFVAPLAHPVVTP